MFAILLVGLIAACAAAPHYHYGLPPPPHYPERPGFGHHRHHYDPFADNDHIFDTRQFWNELTNELRQLDEFLAQFYQRFPSVSSTQGIQDGQYKIAVPLTGFEEKEIVVKAREGLLMVQAVHKLEDGNGERSYLDIKTLPAYVNVTGSWTFENNLLKIVFPLKSDAPTEAPVTEAHSREEVSPGEENVNTDVDVGIQDKNQGREEDLDRTQQGQGEEILTNEIPRNSVEATTYAVDLKDEVEFVPVRYR